MKLPSKGTQDLVANFELWDKGGNIPLASKLQNLPIDDKNKGYKIQESLLLVRGRTVDLDNENTCNVFEFSS